MKQVVIDDVYHAQISVIAKNKGMTIAGFVARAIGGELAKASNQKILKSLSSNATKKESNAK